MKRREAPRRAAKVYQVEDSIALVDAITLLADRDERTNDVDRARKARMRGHIKYAVENGELSEAKRNGEKCYVYGRLTAWAQDKWLGKYDDLDAIRDPSVEAENGVNGVLGGLVGRARGYRIPTKLPDCRRELDRAMQRIFSLQAELIAAREEADRLRPAAAKWANQCAVNKENAQQERN